MPSKDSSGKFSGNDRTKANYEAPRIRAYVQRCNGAKFSEEYLDEIISQIPENGKFLDAGCGVGQFLRQLVIRARDLGRGDIEFHAFDFSKMMLSGFDDDNPMQKGAFNNLEGLGVNIWQADLKDLKSIKDGGVDKFDYIISQNVVFFFNDGERVGVFENFREICGDDGVLDIRIREKRFDLEQSGGFNDFTEHDLRVCLQDAGFQVNKSVIGRKISYGAPGPDNLDRFYDLLLMKVSPDKELEYGSPSKNPSLSDRFSEARVERLKNTAKGRGSEALQ